MKTLFFIGICSFFTLLVNAQENTVLTNKLQVTTSDKLSFTESVVRGKSIYLKKCARCHKKDGTGKASVYPPLAQSDYLVTKPTESIKAIKYGLKKVIFVNAVRYKKRMPRIRLADQEIADVMNYISNAWGNNNSRSFTQEEVQSIKKN